MTDKHLNKLLIFILLVGLTALGIQFAAHVYCASSGAEWCQAILSSTVLM
jgi:hypothetical protein